MITLAPPTVAEFRRIRESAIDDFSREGRPGTWPTEEIARREFDRWFPEGVETPDRHLFSIRKTDGRFVGSLFMTIAERPQGREAFILNLEIFPEFQRKGYAKMALRALETHVVSLGLNKIALSVFNGNQAAIQLYDSAGYRPVFTRMAKKF